MPVSDIRRERKPRDSASREQLIRERLARVCGGERAAREEDGGERYSKAKG